MSEFRFLSKTSLTASLIHPKTHFIQQKKLNSPKQQISISYYVHLAPQLDGLLAKSSQLQCDASNDSSIMNSCKNVKFWQFLTNFNFKTSIKEKHTPYKTVCMFAYKKKTHAHHIFLSNSISSCCMVTNQTSLVPLWLLHDFINKKNYKLKNEPSISIKQLG